MSSRGGRGGFRGRGGSRGKHKIGGQEVSWDAPDGGTPSEPQEFFPNMGQDFPRAKPPTLRERKAVQLFKATRQRIRDGPLHCILSTKARVGKGRPVKAVPFSPFSDLPSYSEKSRKPQRELPRFDTRIYPTRFYPEELLDIFGSSQSSSNNNLRLHQAHQNYVRARDEEEVEEKDEGQDAEAEPDPSRRKLDEDEEPEEAEEDPDDNFEEDDEDMAGDYNAEGYFSGGEGDEDDGALGGDEGAIDFELIQAAGVLLGLSQDIIAQAIVIFTRFWIGADGGSLRLESAEVNNSARNDVATAALHLTCKLSADPQTPRRLILVIKYLRTHPRAFLFPSSPPSDEAAFDLSVTETEYQEGRSRCMRAETEILRIIGYDLHVCLAHTLCINYLQTLGAFHLNEGPSVAVQAFAHLNSLLLSPQLVYLTHQPTALATAAIYLASREVGLKLPELPWWEIFDTGREELGFLVASMTSMEAFVKDEEAKWAGKVAPLTVDAMASA
ncbi:MAG: hypothetical protein Q9159_005559 [Coniocarpon cinnabarinum]